MKKKKTIAIVHYNTPELTEALIASVRKHGGEDYAIVVMDNSDARPFKKRIKGVKCLDNTQGALVDFEKELAKFPDKQDHVRKSSNYASSKHMMSVQWLIDNLGTDFVLLDSDILLRKPIDELFDPAYCAVGCIQKYQMGYVISNERLLPMLCYLNAPVLKKNGALYFDPTRTFGLLAERNARNNWYDTGATIIEDIRRTKPALVAKIYSNLTPYYVHYQHGSWAGNDVEKQKAWLSQYEDLWK